jgi:surface carbohydrate biosynthesis protein
MSTPPKSGPLVVIRAFTLRRDVAAALLLARFLEDKGCRAIVASGRDFLRTLRFGKPDAVVVNTVGQIARVERHAPGAAIVLWPGEGAQAIESSDPMALTRMPGAFEKLDLALLWGRATEKFFHDLFPEADPAKLAVCGNPRLDLAKFHPELLEIPEGGKTVGFIGRFHTINRYNRIPTIFSLQRPEKRDGVIWQVESFIAMITLIHRIIEETDLRISIRPHPLEAPEGYAFMMEEKPFRGRIEIDDSLDVAGWTARQKVILAPSSQSFYESYVLGVPVINLDALTGDVEWIRKVTPHSSLSQQVSHTPSSFDEAMAMIARIPEASRQNPTIDRHLDEFHDWFADQSATLQGAAAIAEMLKHRGEKRGRRGLPLPLLDWWDRVSFTRARWNDPLHPNFSYHRHFHPPPDGFERIVANIHAGHAIGRPRGDRDETPERRKADGRADA